MKYHVPLAAVAMGIQSPENFLGRHGNIEGYQYADFEYVNTKLKPERLLLFGSNGLYIQAPFVLATDWTSRHWAEIRHCDAQTMITVFHVDRITHIMTRESLQNGHSTESTGYRCWKTIQDALGASPVYTEGTTQIFSLPRE